MGVRDLHSQSSIVGAGGGEHAGGVPEIVRAQQTLQRVRELVESGYPLFETLIKCPPSEAHLHRAPLLQWYLNMHDITQRLLGSAAASALRSPPARLGSRPSSMAFSSNSGSSGQSTPRGQYSPHASLVSPREQK